MIPKVSLSDEEKHELKKLEKIITAGFLHMRDCAEALQVIRDKRLYRVSYANFKDYCLAKWGKDRTAVNYMLEAAGERKAIDEQFVNSGDVEAKQLLDESSDKAVRELAKQPKEKRASIIKKAAEKTGKPAAKSIRETANPPPKPSPEPPDEEAAERATVKSIALDLVEKVRQDMVGPYASFDARTVKHFAKALTEKMEEIL